MDTLSVIDRKDGTWCKLGVNQPQPSLKLEKRKINYEDMQMRGSTLV